MKKPIRIFIADDHCLLLDALATLIESIEGFNLVGTATSGKALLQSLELLDSLPDLCILDIEMPDMDGVEATKAIRLHFPAVKIMALTMHGESHFINRMISAGANGYMLKNINRETFERSVYRIVNENSFFTEGTKLSKSNTSKDDQILTHREKQVLRLIAQGKSNKEIAEELFISDRTADTHRTNIKRKTKTNSLAQLIQFSKDNGYW